MLDHCRQNPSGPEIVFEADSQHSHIRIVEENGCRTMFLGDDGQEAETSIAIANPDAPVFEYPGMMFTSLLAAPDMKDIVMLGLGGGFIPRLFQKFLPEYKLAVVEVDALIAELAATYFGFTPGANVEVHIRDGREYIEALPAESAGQIWLDAFGGNYIPPHLLHREFLWACKERLAPGGLLVQNLHQSRPQLFRIQSEATREIFGGYLQVNGLRCGNSVVISFKDPPARPVTPASLKTAAKKFNYNIGPYNLLAESAKLTNRYR